MLMVNCCIRFRDMGSYVEGKAEIRSTILERKGLRKYSGSLAMQDTSSRSFDIYFSDINVVLTPGVNVA
jgi:hypothetical protein